jgi:hypothetical protein
MSKGGRKATRPDLEREADDNQRKEDERNKRTREVLEKLAADISRHWLGNYAGLESLPGIIGTAMLGVSSAKSCTPGKDRDPGWQRQCGARCFK